MNPRSHFAARLSLYGRALAATALLALALLTGAEPAQGGTVLATVNSTGDQPDANIGDTVCDSDLVAPGLQCTIRAAFQELVSGTVVEFDLPGCPASQAACTIAIGSSLPSLANNNEIDGTSQPGFAGDPLIVIDGTGNTTGAAINLGAATNATIRGLVIQNVPDDPGVSGGNLEYLELTDNVIRDNALAGLSVFANSAAPVRYLTLEDNVFSGNGSGVAAGTAGTPFSVATITGNAFSDNLGSGIEVFLAESIVFANNVASGNGGDGARLHGGSGDPLIYVDINNSRFEDNAGTGVMTGSYNYLGFILNEARNNGLDGANLSAQITQNFVANGNTLEDNGRDGLSVRATGSASLGGNVANGNDQHGINVLVEQYVGPDVPPPGSVTFTNNQLAGNTGSGVYATDYFQDFPLVATGNIFTNNGQGLVTTATTMSVSGNTFDLNTAEGLQSNNSDATGSISENTFTSANATGIGIALAGPGVSVSFNRLVGHQAGVFNFGSGTTNAENNWWGCNAGPGLFNPCDPAGGGVDVNPWLVLNAAADPTTIEFGEVSTITADVTVNSNTQGTSSLGAIPDFTLIQIATDLGTFGLGPVGEISTTDGVADVGMLVDDGHGVAHITLTLDNQEILLEVTVNAPPATPTPTSTLPPSTTSSPSVTPLPANIAGDLDCDGEVTPLDALLALLYLEDLGFEQDEPCPNPDETVGDFAFADVNCDGVIDITDVMAIILFAADFTAVHPVGCVPLGEPL